MCPRGILRWFGLVHLVFIYEAQVTGQVTLELRGSRSFFLEGSSFNFTCVQTGTTAVNVLRFLLNNDARVPACLVTPLTSCTFPSGARCGCVSDTGGVRLYSFAKTNMQSSDAGNWTCQLPAVLGVSPAVTSPPLSLPMFALPSVSAVGPSSLAVRDGDDVTVTCEDSRGVPPPSFSWTHPPLSDVTQSTPSPSRATLTFRADKDKGDTVTLTCTASNVVGNASVTFTVSVQYPPPSPPVISGNRDNATYFQNDTVSLTCTVTGGNPPVSNVTLTCPQGHTMTSSGTVSTLTFRAGPSDVGRCECRAFHIRGYSQTAVTNITTF